MKRLYIVRHAKSSWENQLPDVKRPLKKRGFFDANLVSKKTKDIIVPPEMVLCSPARRTQQTAEVFKEVWGFSDTIFHIKNELYDFSGEKLIKTILECNDKVNILMIFAHNFAVTDFVNTFGTIDIDSVPTCGFIVIDFNIDSWKNLNKGKTVYKLFPKQLKY